MRNRLFAVAGLAVVAGLAAGCSQAKKVESAAPPPSVPVRVAQAGRKSLPNVVEAIGTGEAYSNVQVKPQVSGQLTGIFFKEGDFVRKGQLLFTIDPQPFQATLNQAAATLAKAARDRVGTRDSARSQAERWARRSAEARINADAAANALQAAADAARLARADRFFERGELAALLPKLCEGFAW